MSHLGDRVAALVDGELSHDERDLLLGHVAGCPDCRAEVESARFVKAQVARLRCPEPGASFTLRLKALSEPGEPLPPVRPRMPRGPLSPTATATFPTGRPPRRRGGDRSGSRRSVLGVRVLAAAASVTTVTLTGAVLLGGEAEPGGRPVVPPVDGLAAQHGGTSRVVPLTDPVVAADTFGAPGVSFGGSRPPLVGETGVPTASTVAVPAVTSSPRPTSTPSTSPSAAPVRTR